MAKPHDEALDGAGKLCNITAVQRAGGPVHGWRCPGEDDDAIPCLRPLTARALWSTKVAAYFGGSHIEGCSMRSVRSDDEEGDRGHWAKQGPRASRWRARVDDDGRSTGPAGRRRPDDSVLGTRTRRSTTDANEPPINSEDPHSLSGFLDAAVSDALPLEAALPGGPWTPAADLVLEAGEASEARFGNAQRMVWGRVVATRGTPFGGTMLLLDGSSPRIGVLIRKEHRGYFPLADDAEFVGRLVITFGYRIGSAASPYVAVPSAHGVAFNPNVVVRRTPVAIP